MKTKTYKVFDEKGNHEFNIIVEHKKKTTKYSILTSESDVWTYKNDLQLSMVNNGNGIKFDRKIKKVDYSLLMCIRILTNFEQMTDVNPINQIKYEVVLDETTIKV